MKSVPLFAGTKLSLPSWRYGTAPLDGENWFIVFTEEQPMENEGVNEWDVWMGVGVTQYISHPQVAMNVLYQQVTMYFCDSYSNITDHMHATAIPQLSLTG
jgi:hypothetical protein